MIDVKSIVKSKLQSRNILDPLVDKTFEENVKLRYLIDKEVFDKFCKNINNLTRGKVILDDANKKIYFIKDKKIVYFNSQFLNECIGAGI